MILSIFCMLDTSNWIEIVSIIINGVLAFWIAKTLQNSSNNKRVLKDHFIKEVINLRDNYDIFSKHILSNRITPREINSNFKSLNIQATSILSFLNKKYNINTRYLSAYQIEFKKLITELDEFIYNFQTNEQIVLEDASLNKVIRFQQINFGVFNNLIIDINDK